MNNWAVISVFGGAGLGALLRWRLGLWLNPVFPTIPMGTVAANLIGGLLIGLFSAYFQRNPALPPEFRLLIITGFLGGLTTFSTFSAEVVTLIGEGELAWATAAASLHLFGSLLLTATGIYIVNALALRGVST